METKTNEKNNEAVRLRDSTAALHTRAFATVGLNEVAISRLVLFLAMAVGSFLRIWQINTNGLSTQTKPSTPDRLRRSVV